MGARLDRIFERFTDAGTMGAPKVAQLIRQQEIDIVVDLAGFTASNRGAVLAYRPAPIVVHFQGFGTAAPVIDYVIADRQPVPDHLKARDRERDARKPES